MLAKYLFPDLSHSVMSEEPVAPAAVFTSTELGLVRLKAEDLDLFIRTGCNLSADDRRHLGPGILHLSHRGRLLVGTVPVTLSSDARVSILWQGRSVVARHFDLFRYRWTYGFEELQAELAGFVPVLRWGRFVALPLSAVDQRVNGNTLITAHPFQQYIARGPVPAWNHFADLACRNLPAFFKTFLRPWPNRSAAIDFRLTRSIQSTRDAVTIRDRLTGAIEGKRLLLATRLLPTCNATVDGLSPANRLSGWSSDGHQELQMYTTTCGGTECEYSISLLLTGGDVPPRVSQV